MQAKVLIVCYMCSVTIHREARKVNQGKEWEAEDEREGCEPGEEEEALEIQR